ncbi:LysE family translocator [Oceanicola sp. S124]|uniref:LysE family translocator n=1 Tax=Oceanicola sp. S124 TaxID=1042378 RepID=UPI0002559C71|nr:LysE family translocator [Oceanicola sp. S124]
MTIDLLLFIPACFALNLAFGPNNLMTLTNAAQRGVGFALRSGLGRLLAFVPMIALAGLGLGLLLQASAVLFTLVKLAGAAYLIYLGVKLLRAGRGSAASVVPASRGAAFRREIVVALSNPKAILIFAAFFPQFVDPQHYAQSYVTLGLVFLALEACAILVYACAGHFAARAAGRHMPAINRISGGGMIVFGLALLFTRRAAG